MKTNSNNMEDPQTENSGALTKANKENIDTSLRERNSRPVRPASAKHPDKLKQTPKSRFRPNSATRSASGRRSNKGKWANKLPRDINPIVMSRIKPQKFVINRMGKEKLYENNLAL
jgi:hypothetical protein